MGRGGARSGAGRKKGAPNKATIKRQAEVAETGITPLDYMLKVMRNEDAPTARRDEMARASAPYVHPRLAMTQVTGKDGGPIQTATVRVFELPDNGRGIERKT
jgi:hypothetical protein